MKRFFQRIQAKAQNLAEPPILIVALGDSVTQGAMEHSQFAPSVVYHRLMQERLEVFFPGTTFSTINAGVAGESAPEALNRLERDVIRHAPDLVLIAFGLNDCIGGADALPRFSEALRAMVDRTRRETEADIVLLTPPMIARRRSHRIHPQHEAVADLIIDAQNSGKLAAYAEAIRCVAAETSTVLVDVHAEWERLLRQGMDTDLWIINGLNHPDARGHRLAADFLFRRLLAEGEVGDATPE